MPVQIHIITM